MGSAWQYSIDPAECAGKRVLVTGGTEGMGEAVVRRLAGGGARVATIARSLCRKRGRLTCSSKQT